MIVTPKPLVRRSACRWTALLILSVLLPVQGLPPLDAARKYEPASREPKPPRILLTATPAFGFAPLTVQLVATLTGIDPRDARFCHAGVTWIRVDPGSSPETGSRLTEDPGCLPGEEEVTVVTTFSKSFNLSSPGSYLYRIIINGKDGTQIKSNFVKVRVLRIP